MLLSGCATKHDSPIVLPPVVYPTHCLVDWMEKTNAPHCVVDYVVRTTAQSELIDAVEKSDDFVDVDFDIMKVGAIIFGAVKALFTGTFDWLFGWF